MINFNKDFNPSLSFNNIEEEKLAKMTKTSSYNTVLLRNLVITHTQRHFANFNKIDKMVMQAAISVLSDTEPYLLGIKQISDKQYIQIEKKFHSIKEQKEVSLTAKANFFSTRAHRLMSFITRLRKRPLDINSESEVDKIKTDFYQIMACTAAYGKWKVGDKLNGPHALLSDYQVHQIIKNKKGLQIVVFVPTTPTSDCRPIFCCRGTIPSKTSHIIEDLNTHIGQVSFEQSKDEIIQALEEVATAYGPAVVVGHSLGGAVAQNMIAECCDHLFTDSENIKKPCIQGLYYFNAPGVGKEIVEKFENKIQLLPDAFIPKIADYHHAGDVVYLAGGQHLPPIKNIQLSVFSFKSNATVKIANFSFSYWSLSMAIKQSHCWTNLTSEFESTTLDQTSKLRAKLHFIAEEIRSFISFIILRFFVNKINNKQKIEEQIEKVDSFINMHQSKREDKLREYVESSSNLSKK